MPKTEHHGTDGNMPEYATKKPVAITADGKFVMPAETQAPAFALGVGALQSLDTSLQKKLTLARIKADPKYNLGILGMGMFKKNELVAHVEDESDLGRMIIQAEVSYCNDFVASALAEQEPLELPKITAEEMPVPPWQPTPKRIPLWVKNTALFCENTTDSITQYAAQYRLNHIHSAFKTRGFNLVVLKGTDDNATNFVPEAEKPHANYISGIGHGNPTTYTGDHNAPMLQVGHYDPAVVHGKVIHLLSCQTAKQLGPDVVAKGAKAYAGYFENYTFTYDDPKTPVNEMDLFWQCDSAFDILMASGATVETASNFVIALYNAAIAQVPNTAAATWLLWDRNSFRSPIINPIYGDKKATVPAATLIWVPIPLEVEQLEHEEELVKA